MWGGLYHALIFLQARMRAARGAPQLQTKVKPLAAAHHALRNGVALVARESGQQTRPIEARAGIGLASWRDVAVRGELAQRR